jgi:predicted DNA binding protein
VGVGAVGETGGGVSVLAGVLVDAGAFALGEVFAGIDARIELARVVPLDGAFTPCVRIDRPEDIDAFERQVEADLRVERVWRLGGGVDRVLYRIEWAEGEDLAATDDVLAAIRAGGLLVERAVASPAGQWLFRLRAPGYEAISAFEAACSDAGIAIDVREIAHDPMDGTAYGLTDKQREALVLAFDEGYFDVPSETSLSELATLLNISRQAYTRRLDRALRNYLSSTGIEAL